MRVLNEAQPCDTVRNTFPEIQCDRLGHPASVRQKLAPRHGVQAAVCPLRGHYGQTQTGRHPCIHDCLVRAGIDDAHGKLPIDP